MGVLSFLANMLAYKPYEICQLETPSTLDPYSLLTHDGSMVTLIKLKGAYRFYSEEQESAILRYMANQMRQNFMESGHRIDFVVDLDSSRSESYVDSALSSIDAASKAMGYQNEQVNLSEKRLIAQVVKPELAYIVLTTSSEVLDLANLKEGNQNRRKLAEEYGFSLKNSGTTTQNHWVETNQIFDAHRSFTTQMLSTLSEYVLFEKIEAHEALVEIRNLLYRDFDNEDNWQPATRKNSDVKFMTNHKFQPEVDEIGHTALHAQIMEEPFEDSTKASYKYFNGKCYTALERYLVGDEPQLMRHLINRVGRNIPLRIMYSLVSGSERIKRMKSTKMSLTTFVAKTNPISNQILKACNRTTEFIQNGGCAVECYMSVVVWGNNEKEASTRFKALQSAIRGWGGERQRMCSFPIEGILSSLPGFSSRPLGRASNDDIESALKSAPIIRPASPWESGVMCFVTPEGKPWAMDFDSAQSHHFNLVAGSMGSGKSVLAGAITRAIHFLSGTSNLPLIAGVDYGESIKYTFETIQSNLKPEDRNKIQQIDLSNQERYAYNLLEPQYGYNKLAKPENNTTTAFLSKIVNGGSLESVHGQLDNCLSSIVDRMVDNAIRLPKAIDPSLNGSDLILKQLETPAVKSHLKQEKNISYLNARNALFKASCDASLNLQYRTQCLHLSKIAHRYIWPLVSDLPQFVKSQEVRSSMGTFMVGNQPLIELIASSVALCVERYNNILARYPQRDYSDLSMMFVNAKPVVDSAPESMKSAWFILAKGLAQRHFWVHPQDVKNDADPVFYGRAMAIAKQKEPLPKYYFHDEFEQAKCIELEVNLDKEVKTARKYREIITLLTQLYESYPASLKDLATNTFICNIPGIETELALKKQFKLSDDEFAAFEQYVGKTGIIDGIGRGFLYVGKLKAIQAPIVQPIVSVLPPSLVWSLASDAEDAYVRREIVSIVGGRCSYDDINMALGAVASYPDTKALIKRRVENEQVTDKVVYKELINNVIQHLVDTGKLDA